MSHSLDDEFTDLKVVPKENRWPPVAKLRQAQFLPLIIPGVCLVLRGQPGSGKVKLVQKIHQTQERVRSFSTDRYLTVGGRFAFERSRQQEAHNKCLIDFSKAAFEKLDPGWQPKVLICANGNIHPMDAAPYMAIALASGWTTFFVTLRTSPDKVQAKKLSKAQEQNESIEKMDVKLPHRWLKIDLYPDWEK